MTPLGARFAITLFDAQARDDAWAVPVESFLAAEVRRFFEVVLPDAEDVTVACRESMCLLQ